MSELQGRTNQSFGGSETGSPGKKSKSSWFRRKPDTTNQQAVELAQKQDPIDQQNPQQQQQQLSKTKAKAREMYKRNIADGRVKLRVAESDKVHAGTEYRENLYDVLDQAPMRTTSYIENLRSRDFHQINNREVKRFIESQKQQKEIRPNLHVENLEIELLDLSRSYDTFLGKFFRFFQGLLPGFCIIHLFLIFGGGTDQAILNSYVLTGLRINQIFYVVAMISTLGAVNRYVETKSQYKESIQNQPMLRESFGRQATKYLVASICYFVVYALIVFNHEFVAKSSDVNGTVKASNFVEQFKVFRALSVVMTVLSVIGWTSLVLAFEELNKSHMENMNYSELTGDESFEDVA